MNGEQYELDELGLQRGKLVSVTKWLAAGSPRPTLPLGPLEETMSSVMYTEQKASSDLLMPTLGELLDTPIPERQHILRPWLREHESCLLFAATGVGKSLFALTTALAVAGNGRFLGWRPDVKADGTDWRVLYVDGEMHIGDIQQRARILMDAVPGISRTKAYNNLQLLARQQQDPAIDFPEITDTTKPGGGQERILQKVLDGGFDLLILDNFSTLGRVVDECCESVAFRLHRGGAKTGLKALTLLVFPLRLEPNMSGKNRGNSMDTCFGCK
jgi:AAA domain-containing protein